MPSNFADIDSSDFERTVAGSDRKTILIADRNPLLAEVLASHLNGEGERVCVFVDNTDNICAEIARVAPDVFVLDPAHLPLTAEHDINDFGKKVRIAHPQTRMLGYSFKVSLSMIRAAIEAGFHGCISKKARLEDLEAALTVVLGGGVYFDKEFGSQLQPMLADAPNTDPLSEREKEVLIGLARGLSAKQIAYDLKISSKTVDTYKARATQKLDLPDRAKLVNYVMAQGWLN